MTIRKTLPMYEEMSQLQLEINAAGIPRQQYNFAKIMQLTKKQIKVIQETLATEEDEYPGVIRLKQFSSFFTVIGIYFGISFIVFLCEIFVGNFKSILKVSKYFKELFWNRKIRGGVKKIEK